MELKIREIDRQHVGLGRAILSAQTVRDNSWTSGQILELVFKRKTYVKLWRAADCGPDEILVDGATRQNIGAGIGDRIGVAASDARPAEVITLSPTENIGATGLPEYMRQNYMNQVFAVGDVVSAGTMTGGRLQFVVSGTRPSGPVIASEGTVFETGGPYKGPDHAVPHASYDDLGGLDDAVRKIREMVEAPMRRPELFEKMGIEAPKGVLLHGPPGTGKTLLARAVAGETSAHFVSISGPEIMGRYYGESEERLREVFEEAKKNEPSIIFIDEMDSIAPKRDDVSGEVEKRIVSQLLVLMDGIRSRGKIVVIGATNRPDSIDAALRRPGRFDREIEIGIPNESGRRSILEIHTRGMPVDKAADLDNIAKLTHGFVGADIDSLCKEAAMAALRRAVPDMDRELSAEELQGITVTNGDFVDALRDTRPSALREVLVQTPNTTWDMVGGLDELKKELEETTVWPVRHAEWFREAGVRSPRGILLHGPPGTGKTLIAKAVAGTTESNFISIKGPELLSKWVGESERGVREIFRKARAAAPCVVFFDEIDALIPRRGGGERHTEGVVSQVLTEMDGLVSLDGVLVVGATNRLDMIDPALLRPGRFDSVVEVPKPDLGGRRQIFEIHARGKPLADGVDLDAVARETDGFSGAEIESVCNESARAALRRRVAGSNGMEITLDDLLAAANKIRESPEHTATGPQGSGDTSHCTP